jgi:hypothetical protein
VLCWRCVGVVGMEVKGFWRGTLVFQYRNELCSLPPSVLLILVDSLFKAGFAFNVKLALVALAQTTFSTTCAGHDTVKAQGY